MHALDPKEKYHSHLAPTLNAGAQNAIITGPIGRLPEELLLQIFSYLGSAKDVASLGLACKTLNQISKDDEIWLPLFHRHFPYVHENGKCHLDIYKKFTIGIRNAEIGKYELRTVHLSSWSPCLQVTGNLLIAGLGDNTIKIYDIETVKRPRTLKGHTDTVNCLQIAGNRLFTGSLDHTIKIWNLETGKCLQTLEGHTDKVSCLQVVGNLLYTGSWDGTIKIWDINTGECLQTLKGAHS